MVTDIQNKLTMMSVTTLKPRPPQPRQSQSPTPRDRFDDRDYTRCSPTPDTSRTRPQGTYRPNLQSNYNRQFDRRPMFSKSVNLQRSIKAAKPRSQHAAVVSTGQPTRWISTTIVVKLPHAKQPASYLQRQANN